MIGCDRPGCVHAALLGIELPYVKIVDIQGRPEAEVWRYMRQRRHGWLCEEHAPAAFLARDAPGSPHD